MAKRPFLLTTPCAEQIYDSVRSETAGQVPIGDIPFSDKHRNLYRLLLTPYGKRLLALSATAVHALNEDASDYDNFTELLHLLPSTAGSGYHSFVRLALETLCGISAIPSPDEACTVWKDSLSLFQDETLDGLLAPFARMQLKDVTEWHFPSAKGLSRYDTLEEYLSSYREAVKGASVLRLDLSYLRFRSPDPYHAEVGFRALRSGDGGTEDRRYLASQLLRVTGEICKGKRIPLLLAGDFGDSETDELLRYLKKTDRLPRLLLCMPFDHAREVDRRYRIAEACGLLDVLSGIVPTDLPYCSASAMRETLQLSAMRYPLSKHCFLAEGMTEAEIRIGYERFLRILSQFLSDMVMSGEITEDDAAACGRSVLSRDGVFLTDQT